MRGFPPERQDRYPVAGGAVEGVDRAADAEEEAVAAHDPLGPSGYVEERDITGGPVTNLADRSADEPYHEPRDLPGDTVTEGPDAGPVLQVEPEPPSMGEVTARHRRADEQESKYLLDATLGSRWLLPLASTLQVTRLWIRDVALALGTNDPRDAWHALRAVLATLRDQLPLAEVADLGAGLPIAVRGVYYEGWSGRMDRAESRERFLAAVEARLGPNAEIDPDAAVQAVVRVLAERISAGELRHVQAVLPQALKGVVAPA